VAALATAIGRPLGWDGVGQPPAGIAPASGKAFYFLWSLERVAMVLNLERIGDRDWYSWGSEILLASQSPEGTWVGDYKSGGVDTCFALLFLKKSNLARDLSGNLSSLGSGKVLRAAREKGASTNRDAPPLAPSGIGKKEAGSSSSPESGPGKLNPPAKGEKTAESIPAPKETMVPKPAKSPEDPARVMAQSLLRARGQERSDLVRSMRDSKGVSFTEALLWVIPMLDESGRREVRVALAERFTRLKDATLRDYLRDEESEIRRAAALAAAARESRALIPDLIERINDSEELVRRAAQTSLKELTGKDFGPGPGSTMTETSKAYQAWLSWWKKQTRD